MSYTYTTSFPELSAHRTRTGRCPVCGKTTRRSRTFTMTVNPFNKNPDGSVRTRDEVRAAVAARADAWQPDFTHAGCVTTGSESDR